MGLFPLVICSEWEKTLKGDGFDCLNNKIAISGIQRWATKKTRRDCYDNGLLIELHFNDMAI